MSRFERPHVETVVRHLRGDGVPPLVVAVTGPRQTGKTTIIRQALERAGLPHQYVPLDRPDDPLAGPGRLPDVADGGSLAQSTDPSLDRSWLVRLWKGARQKAKESERGFVLALDEVQHVEGWSGVVKGLWDRDRIDGLPLRVIVSGSAPWSLLVGLHESMMGRFFPIPVRHWSLAEMAHAFGFSLDEYLFFGGYPGAAPLKADLNRWRRYIQDTILGPAIQRDIVGLAHVRKPSLMRRLVALAPDYSGQILSYNKMVGQLQEAGNTTTLAHYLDLLSDAGIIAGLSKYSAKPYLGRASSPKLNVLNTAFMTASSGYALQEARADRSFWGRIVESAVGAHLHNTRQTSTQLHYWRDDRGREVDFVLSRGPRLLAIEVKSGGRRRTATGLETFKSRFPRARTLLVGTGGVPLNEFLSLPANYWLDEYEADAL